MGNSLYIGGFLVVAGGILAVVGLMEVRVAAAASKVPEEISLRDLIARGPDGNPNIILKDYELASNFVYKTRNNVWQSAWVPAVPRGGIGPGLPVRPGGIQALIFTINARDPVSLNQLCNQPKLRALVTNKIVSLGSEEKRLLEQSYPGTDFSRCLIIQEGREPAGPVKVILMVGGGSVLVLGGLGVVGFGLYRWAQARGPSRRPKRRRREDDEEEQARPRKRRMSDDEEDDRPRRRRRDDD